PLDPLVIHQSSRCGKGRIGADSYHRGGHELPGVLSGSLAAGGAAALALQQVQVRLMSGELDLVQEVRLRDDSHHAAALVHHGNRADAAFGEFGHDVLVRGVLSDGDDVRRHDVSDPHASHAVPPLAAQRRLYLIWPPEAALPHLAAQRRLYLIWPPQAANY